MNDRAPMFAAAPPVLVAEGLSRQYPVRTAGGLFGQRRTCHAVDGVSFTLEAGRTLGLVGESGCGKSTTARLALGLEAPSQGHVQFENQPLPARGTEPWRQLRQRMQMVYQDPLSALDRRMPVIAQVVEPLTVFERGTPAERYDKAAQLLTEFGLAPALHQRLPHELSGGQRQRVVLARALINDPVLLVCDEPISALDVSIQAQVINLLADIQARRGVALLFISHDLRIVRQVSDTVAVMYLGRIVEQGDPQALFERPAHPYTRALISAIPTIRSGAGGRLVQRIRLEGDPPNPIDRPSGCAFHPRCPVAVARCSVESPELRTQERGRLVACHLAGAEPAPGAH